MIAIVAVLAVLIPVIAALAHHGLFDPHPGHRTRRASAPPAPEPTPAERLRARIVAAQTAVEKFTLKAT